MRKPPLPNLSFSYEDIDEDEDVDAEVWGLDQTTWELMWAGEAAMPKSIPALRQAGYESISDLPRIQQSHTEKALVVIGPVMRIGNDI